MNPESLRPLTFGVVLIHPPLLHSDKVLRELFSALGTAHEFTQFQQPTEGTASFQRVRRGTNERLACTINKENIELVHDFPSSNLEGFWRTIQDVLSESIELLKIPAFLFQQHLIRKLANPYSEMDARKFLSEKVCSLDDKQLKIFGRPLHGIGLRFFFPASQETPFEFDVKAESRLADITQLFLENTAKFFTPLQVTDLAPLKRNLEETDRFLSETLVKFLCQFNVRSKEGGGT